MDQARGSGRAAGEVTEAEAEDRLCVICLVNERDTTVLPCRHMCMCHECAQVPAPQPPSAHTDAAALVDCGRLVALKHGTSFSTRDHHDTYRVCQFAFESFTMRKASIISSICTH